MRVTRTQYRALLVVSWLLLALAVAAYFIAKKSLPMELQQWLNDYNSSQETRIPGYRLLIDLFYLVMNIVVAAGLFFFQRWAKMLFIPLTLFGLALLMSSRISIEVEWSRAISTLCNITNGVILALIYCSPVSRMFESKGDVQQALGVDSPESSLYS
jgi:hypothetical protein